ncbi:MAG TPA: SpoIIE family protein phosphatase [Acidobacteriota bacterium]|jgi:serine phosphatase RsbU (regulator of sigma subunit)
MTLRLTYQDSGGRERSVQVEKPLFTIGRSHKNDLCLPLVFVSRAHAEISQQGDQYVLKDLGSRHGTYLNGSKIDWAVLQEGDRIQLGNSHELELRVQGSQDAFSALLKRSTEEAGDPNRGFKDVALLLETFTALNSSFVLEELLNLVIDSALALSEADRGFIMLKEADESLSLAVGRGRGKKNLELTSLAISQKAPREALRKRRTVLLTDLGNDPEYADHTHTRALGLQSVCCIPLRINPVAVSADFTLDSKPEMIGVLYLDCWSNADPFTGETLYSLESLALEAAMAIDKARSYKVSLEKKKIDEELSIAREIQQQLSPQKDFQRPWVDVCSINLPCREIGGDYFDYLELSDDKLGVAIADVAGKGTPAALLTSMLQGAFCAHAEAEVPITETVANVNRALRRRKLENRFVTFFYGILSSDGAFQYVNAGHNPPVLLQRSGVRRLERGGLILGLFDAQYESETVMLEDGDLIVLFTDGLSEALNEHGEEFGEERLIEWVRHQMKQSARQVTYGLIENLRLFTKDVPLADDVTLMAMKYRSAG